MRRLGSWTGRIGLVVLLGLAPGLAHGQPAAKANPEELRKAKELFDVGAREYEGGRFDSAIQAFEQAYKIAPREGIMFSMAQAHRRQFTRTSDQRHLQAAVRLYKDYVARVKTGGRITDAVRALGEIEPQLRPDEPDAQPPPSAKPITRLVVNIVVPGTQISIDNGPLAPPPVSLEVTPGKHSVRLVAPGYFDETREVVVSEGEIAPANLPQREKPARLTIETTDGADVSIDGRFIGQSPLPGGLELPSGPHFVSVLKNGHETYSAELSLERGKEVLHEAPLDTTTQRTLSYGVLGGAAGFLVAGGVFTSLSLIREADATALRDAQETASLTRAEVAAYEEARSDRSLYTALAIGGGGAAAALGLLSVGLFAFDEPRPATPPRLTPSDEPAPTPAEPADVEMTGANVSVNSEGFSVSARFRY